LFITAEFGGPSEFPDDSGNFQILNSYENRDFLVEGEREQSQPLSRPTPPQAAIQPQESGAFRRFNLPGFV